MEKRTVLMVVLMLLAMPSLHADIGDKYSWLSIDCGATNTSKDELTKITWQIDDEFMKTGANKLLSMNTNLTWMNTLRYFSNRKDEKNYCYELPIRAQTKYLLRAGFYYGDYDNLRSPPTFDLEFDGNHWVTVTTSLGDEPIYHEVIYFTKQELVSVCLRRTQQGQVPFISSLEAISIDDEVYRLMRNETEALYLESRINYGADQSFPERFDQLAENYNRFWKPEQIPSYGNLFSGTVPSFSSMAENYPPNKVLVYAIEAQNFSESIFLSVDFHEKTQLSAYFVFYFAEVEFPPPIGTRRLSVYIDGQEKNTTTVSPRGIDEVAVVSIYPVNVTGGSANVTISPAEGATLPPILNAMEVFTAIDVSTSNANDLLSLSSWSSLLVYYLGILLVWIA